ncbi:unnamed protein product [Triticum turgidum subsp. durum]|uniref:Glutamine amidotransferase domain-containing protein n=1 Tax=Triticum turgidum subsp. durum TaxID=4567 RepID=A0A9R1R9F0_TRITD|nr:unnamed protein product [Triticum turgidum subsp. durum]
MTAEIDGMALWRLGVRCAEMGSRRRRSLSGVMVTLMAEWPEKYMGELGLNFEVYRNDELTIEEGVQFHPESIITPEGKKIILNFARYVEEFEKQTSEGK